MSNNILFIGSFFSGSTSIHRLNAVSQVSDNVSSLNQRVLKSSILILFDRILNKIIKKNINTVLLNNSIIAAANNPLTLIWLDKVLHIYPSTIKLIRDRLPEIKFIHYSPDDMMNPANQTEYYLSCIPVYDLHVTTKSYNVDELYKLGAKKVLFVNNAYAPEIHKPFDLTSFEKAEYSSDVSFIGGPEKQRADSINFIAENGIKVTVWGNGWSKFLINHPNIKIKKGWFADEEYSKIICATKINLAFLRKVNRDLQTTRTMEIPACGGFMLAERTAEHLALFKEDEEAVFFNDNIELLTKIKNYLRNDDIRIRIAANGLKRCLKSGYDNNSMVKKVLNYL